MPKQETTEFQILINTNPEHYTRVDFWGNPYPKPYHGFVGWYGASQQEEPYLFPPWEKVAVPDGAFQNFLAHHGTRVRDNLPKGLEIYNALVHDPQIEAWKLANPETPEELQSNPTVDMKSTKVMQTLYKCDFCQYRNEDAKNVNEHLMKRHKDRLAKV